MAKGNSARGDRGISQPGIGNQVAVARKVLPDPDGKLGPSFGGDSVRVDYRLPFLPNSHGFVGEVDAAMDKVEVPQNLQLSLLVLMLALQVDRT